MKRWNLREAFIGEPSLEAEGTRRLREGQDAVELDITGGKVTLVVSASTPDGAVFQPQAFAQSSSWEIELEGGLVATFQLPEDAISTSVHVALRRR